MHSSLKRWELKIVSPTFTFSDVQEALDAGDSAIILGGLHVVLQQQVKLIIALAILADLPIQARAIFSLQERNNSEKSSLKDCVRKRRFQLAMIRLISKSVPDRIFRGLVVALEVLKIG